MKINQLLTEETWVKGYHAVDAQGNPVSPKSDQAEKFDLMGAVIRLYDPPDQKRVIRKLKSNIKVTQKFTGKINDFNDSATWDMIDLVLRWCDV